MLMQLQIARSKKQLNPSGQLILEINQYLGLETVELLKYKEFSNTALHKNIFESDRMIKASIK